MYKVNLTEAYFPAQPDADYRERTIEELLREQAAARPDASPAGLPQRDHVRDLPRADFD